MNKTKRIDRPNRKVCRACGRWKQWETDKNVGTCDFDGGISSYNCTCVGWIDRHLYEAKNKEKDENRR